MSYRRLACGGHPDATLVTDVVEGAVRAKRLRHAGNRWTTYLESAGVRLCQAYPALQDWAVKQIETTLEHGFGTAFLDQAFAEDYCFATHHGHPVGAPTHAGCLAWWECAVIKTLW